MKKAIYMMAACAVALFASCGGNKVETTDSTAAGAETEVGTETDVKTVAQAPLPEYTLEFEDTYKSFKVLDIDSTSDDQKVLFTFEFTLAKPMPENKMGNVQYDVVFYDADGVRLHNHTVDPRYLSKKMGKEVKNEANETITFVSKLPKKHFPKVSKIYMR